MELFWDAYHEMILLFLAVIVLVTMTYMLIKHRHNKKTKRILKENDLKLKTTSAKTDDDHDDEAPMPHPKTEPTFHNESTSKVDTADFKEDVHSEKTNGKQQISQDTDKKGTTEKSHRQEDSVKGTTNKKQSDDTRNDSDKKTENKLGKYHVLYRKDDKKWYVKREGSDKVLRVLPTQKEAIAWATIKAIHQDTALIIHKKNNQIRKHQKI